MMPNQPNSLLPLLFLTLGEFKKQTEVQFKLYLFGRDLLLTISGGEAHLGSISMTDGPKQHSYSLASHKEGALSKAALQEVQRILEPTKREILIVSGIHYEDISPESIQAILDHCEQLTGDLILKLPAILGSLS